MAFWNRKRGRAILASAAPVQPGAGTTTQGQAKPWQDEVWDLYDTVGEFRQGVTWLSNVMSRARIIPALAPQNPGDEPTPIDPATQDPAVDLVQSIAGGIGGQGELLRSATVHLTVPGEGWLVGATGDEETSWKMYSRDEVRTRSGSVQVRVDEQRWVPLSEESLPVRIWRPHDRRHWQATSSSQAALPILRRLELLNRKVDAQILSRLASNGIYWIPSEMEFPAKPGYEDADDPFIAELIDLAKVAIQTPGSAQAAIPLFVRAAGERIAQLRYDEFAKLIDPQLRADREFEIKRLSTAQDVPAEVLLGMVDVNHWTGWQIEESALKTTVTSLLELICWSLTTGYLRPGLRAYRDLPPAPLDQDVEAIDPDAERIVWYDLSELSVRPDRSGDTINLWKELAVSDECLMRETGLAMSDLLVDPDELRRRLGTRIALGQGQASTLEVGLELMGITTVAKPTDVSGEEAPLEPSDVEGLEPGNPGDMPRNDDERTTPSTNGDEPTPAPVPGR